MEMGNDNWAKAGDRKNTTVSLSKNDRCQIEGQKGFMKRVD